MKGRKPRVLSISYDASLLVTRHAMLEMAGYEVVSLRDSHAVEQCLGDFDLIILGHSIPQKDKRTIVAELHEHGCNAPLLSLLRHGEDKIPEAAHAVDPNHPRDLLDAVQWVLGQRRA